VLRKGHSIETRTVVPAVAQAGKGASEELSSSKRAASRAQCEQGVMFGARSEGECLWEVAGLRAVTYACIRVRSVGPFWGVIQWCGGSAMPGDPSDGDPVRLDSTSGSSRQATAGFRC